MKDALIHENIIYNMVMKYIWVQGDTRTNVICRHVVPINIQMDSVEYTVISERTEIICVKYCKSAVQTDRPREREREREIEYFTSINRSKSTTKIYLLYIRNGVINHT
jgi:hypothetical protein